MIKILPRRVVEKAPYQNSGRPKRQSNKKNIVVLNVCFVLQLMTPETAIGAFCVVQMET